MGTTIKFVIIGNFLCKKKNIKKISTTDKKGIKNNQVPHNLLGGKNAIREYKKGVNAKIKDKTLSQNATGQVFLNVEIYDIIFKNNFGK